MTPPITLNQLREAVGTEVGLSGWRTVSQDMINRFADATDDHQFIHVDVERAKAEREASKCKLGHVEIKGYTLRKVSCAVYYNRR
jgi:acyl dehydratase